MKDTHIRETLDSMLAGLEIPADKNDELLLHIISENKQKKNSPSRKILLTVICALLVSATLGYSVGMPMLQVLTKWNSDIYTIQIDMKKPMPGVFSAAEQPEEVLKVWGKDIGDIMLDINACTRLPKWMPERFKQTYDPSIVMDEIFGHEIILRYAAEDGSELKLSIRVLPEDGSFSSTSYMQHDNTENEVWEYSDTEYILLKNFEYHSLNWQENNCTVHMWGSFTRDEALKMVKSIYE